MTFSFELLKEEKNIKQNSPPHTQNNQERKCPIACRNWELIMTSTAPIFGAVDVIIKKHYTVYAVHNLTMSAPNLYFP